MWSISSTASYSFSSKLSAVRRWNSSENFRRKERTLVRRKLHLIALPPCHQARHLVWWKWFPWLKYYQRWSIESNVAPVEDSFPAIISLEFLCYHDTTILKVTKSFAKILMHSVWKITTKSLILLHCGDLYHTFAHYSTFLAYVYITKYNFWQQKTTSSTNQHNIQDHF